MIPCYFIRLSNLTCVEMSYTYKLDHEDRSTLRSQQGSVFCIINKINLQEIFEELKLSGC